MLGLGETGMATVAASARWKVGLSTGFPSGAARRVAGCAVRTETGSASCIELVQAPVTAGSSRPQVPEHLLERGDLRPTRQTVGGGHRDEDLGDGRTALLGGAIDIALTPYYGRGV